MGTVAVVTLGIAGWATPSAAQAPVRALQDLIGARGSSGEEQLRSRGYTYVRTDKSGDASFTYWRAPQTIKCVSVRTADGRYTAIVFTPDSDCQAPQAPAAGGGSSASGGEDDFDTVCGVEVDGQTYRYRCHLRNQGCAPGSGGGKCRTTVTMPDNEYVITWLKNDEIEVTFSGMVPKRSTSAFQHGQTRFTFDGKVYFVYRERNSGQRELSKLP
jgi:hypothetical protein